MTVFPLVSQLASVIQQHLQRQRQAASTNLPEAGCDPEGPAGLFPPERLLQHRHVQSTHKPLNRSARPNKLMCESFNRAGSRQDFGQLSEDEEGVKVG